MGQYWGVIGSGYGSLGTGMGRACRPFALVMPRDIRQSLQVRQDAACLARESNSLDGFSLPHLGQRMASRGALLAACRL